ncbi:MULTISPECIES: hypothetical protein [Streptomyces]|uniref:Transposase n=1 Tax=Streptomyces eurythermus TaxID=42237 RepID=A0ABW6Z6Q8_9ACTN|nr:MULTISPECIES: hypothetical protein [Streptomyces]
MRTDGLQTAVHTCPTRKHRKEQHDMNLLTDILAGLAHFLGWLI